MKDDTKQIFTEEDYIPKQTNFRHPILTKEEFDKIKELSFRGEPPREIAAIMGRGVSTVSRAKNSGTYEGYFEKSRGYSSKYKKNYSPPGDSLLPPEEIKDAINVEGSPATLQRVRISYSMKDDSEPLSLEAIADAVAERVITKLLQRLVR